MKLSITTLRTLFRNLEYNIDEAVDELYDGDGSFRNVITTVLADTGFIGHYVSDLKSDIDLMEGDEYMEELRNRYIKSAKELESFLKNE